MGAFQILLPDFFQHPHSVAMTTAFVSTSIPGQQRRWWMFNDTLYRTRALTHTRTRKLLTFATELSLRLFDKNVKKKRKKYKFWILRTPFCLRHHPDHHVQVGPRVTRVHVSFQ